MSAVRSDARYIIESLFLFAERISVKEAGPEIRPGYELRLEGGC